MNDLIRQYANLPPEKQELFKKLLSKQGVDPTSLILPLGRASTTFPLSYAQQRLWFLDQLEPGSPLYHVATAVRLKGTLDKSILERCIQGLVQRHETLRTVFSMTAEDPVQKILPELDLPINWVDLSECPAEEQEEICIHLLKEEAQIPFDLSKGPLIRITLYRLNNSEHIALLVMHHIITDGWSMTVFIRELANLYAAYSLEMASNLPPQWIQYPDYAVWQRNWLEGTRLEEQIDYWKLALANLPDPLELPVDHQRPAIQTFRGSTHSFIIPSEQYNRFLTLDRKSVV